MKKVFVLICLVLLPLRHALFAQSLDGKLGAAVKGLEQTRRLQVAVQPPVIRGTNTVTALSEYLRGEISHYAVNSPAFTVVDPARGGTAETIEGDYADTGILVRVTLRLVLNGSAVSGPQSSSIYLSTN